MKLGIVTRKDENEKWGGDLKALYGICEGLKEIGQEAALGRSAQELKDVDLIFLSSTALDLREEVEEIQKRGQPFGIICFHEDRDKYFGPCLGFAHYMGLCVNQTHNFVSLEQLLDDPEIIHHFSYAQPAFFHENFPILGQAEICIATSPTEKQTLLRDCPQCRAEVVYLDCGITQHQRDDAFLRWTGLKRGEYALQVGRMEPRKNQMATILAMKDLDIPLVFIATKKITTFTPYEKMCVAAIKKWRKAPTLIITQTNESGSEGNFQILNMPDQKILPLPMLLSAYENAGLFVHPAFYELPGLVYLEAARMGIPIIASEWTVVKDYFTDPLDDGIAYVPPHHIQELEALIPKQFGKKVQRNFALPTYQRTKGDVARQFLKLITEI
jgi:glycosyltransferase involved in cell wall biosynthesis